MRIVANMQTIWKTTQVRVGQEIDIPDSDAMRWIRLGIARPVMAGEPASDVSSVMDVATESPVDDTLLDEGMVIEPVFIDADTEAGYDDETTEKALVVNKDNGTVAAPKRKYTRRARAIED